MENISQTNEETQNNNNKSINLPNNNDNSNENPNTNDKSRNKSSLNESTNSFNMEAPIKLIDFEGSKFKLNPAAIEFLKSITEDLVIVSVVGKARTGKSYLMNLLLDIVGKTKGFDVDSTINSCTKGIWIWGGTRKKQGSNEKIIFIDSEGTSSIDRSTKTYDSKIFALVVLVSSLFIYNTTGNIDENSISELSLAAHLSSSIAANATEEKENIILELSPKFIWVIRDFTLNKTLPGTDIEIDNKEYLEISLRKKTSGKNSADNNLIRENLLKYFPDRDCVTLPRPVEEEADLRNLKNIPFENLKPNFKLDYNVLKNKIFKESKAKRFRGKAINGATLANLITAFIDSMNSGLVPNITNTWDSIVKDEINACFEAAISKFKNALKVFSSENYEQENLIVLLRKEYIRASLSVLDVLKKNPDILYNDKYMDYYRQKESSMKNECESLMKKREEDNYDKTKKSNINLFKNEFRSMQNKMFRNEYGTENLRYIKIDLNEFYAKFQKESIGPTKNDVFIASLCSGWKDIVFYLGTTVSSSTKTKIFEYENKLTSYKSIFEETTSGIRELENQIEKQTFQLQNLESENGWKTKECGYLYDKIKNLESALEKARLKEISDKYNNNANNTNLNNNDNSIFPKNFNNNNNNNNLKFSVSEYNDLVENTNKTKQNLITKDYYEPFGNGNSKITFEDGSGKDECACNCIIY